VPRSVDGHLDLVAALRCLAARGVNSVLAEGGPGIATALLRGGLADRLLMVQTPIVGGPGARAFGELGPARMIGDLAVRRLGRDIVVSAELGGRG
jgi:diaminohydroxyphosphoribosylaminopyrimidine deaminase/5-amino-6-(5-phosphoribosylamino)uracil reductase